MTDAEINALKRGGHDLKKLYAAFSRAKAHRGQPTVILAKTKKGYGLGGSLQFFQKIKCFSIKIIILLKLIGIFFIE